MKVLHYFYDRDIDAFIRRYGVTRLAERVGCSASYLSQCLKGKYAMDETIYNKAKEEIKSENI